MGIPWITITCILAGSYMVVKGSMTVKIIGIILIFVMVGINVMLRLRK